MPKKNNVLMLIENSSYPLDVRVRAEAETLTSNGYDVSVICPALKGQSLTENCNGVKVFRYSTPNTSNSTLGYLIEYSYSLLAMFVISFYIFFRYGFDIIHAANPPDILVFIAIFYKLFGKRFIFDQHDLAPELYKARFTENGNKSTYNNLVFLEKLSCKVANHIISTNESYKKNNIKRAKVPEDKITVVRNGPKGLNLSAEPYSSFKLQNEKILVYVGVIGVQDGVEYLIHSLNKIIYQFERKDIFCIIVGDGDALARVKVLADELKVTDFVKYTGMVNRHEVARYLNTADICVAPEPSNPYTDRSTVIKIMEYMAFGKPIVAFDLPEHRFSAQDAAIYAIPNDVINFAEKIIILMDNPGLCKRIGQIGRNRVENVLAWEYQAKNLLDVYTSL